MDTLLLFVTVLSLASAFVAVMAVRKLKRQDQLRSEARIAALMSAADETVNVAPVRAAAAPARAASTAGAWNTVAGEMRWTPEHGGTSEPAGVRDSGLGIRSARPIERIPAPEPRATSSDATSGAFFGTVQ